jgi:hypothetical protein
LHCENREQEKQQHALTALPGFRDLTQQALNAAAILVLTLPFFTTTALSLLFDFVFLFGREGLFPNEYCGSTLAALNAIFF